MIYDNKTGCVFIHLYRRFIENSHARQKISSKVSCPSPPRCQLCGDPADSRRYPHLRILNAEKRQGCASGHWLFPRHWPHLQGIHPQDKDSPVAFFFSSFYPLSSYFCPPPPRTIPTKPTHIHYTNTNGQRPWPPSSSSAPRAQESQCFAPAPSSQ